MKNVIFFTSSHRIGLTGLLSEQACFLNKYREKNFLFISGEREQFPGLFDKLRHNNVRHEKIEGLDDHKDLFRIVREFNLLVDQFRPDIVHTQTNWQFIIALMTKMLHRKHFMIFYTVHGYRHNYRWRSIAARYIIGLGLYLFANKIITSSSFLKSKFSFLKGRNEVIFLGLDDNFLDDFDPPLFNGIKRIVFPGEFRKGKNQDMLIRALKKYIDETGDCDVELYLAGEGKKLEEYRRLVSKFGLEEKVCFTGFLTRDKMSELYRKCQFAVVPSNAETFGLCIVEPFVLGRVVISRHVGVADDIIIHGENGFLYDTTEELIELLIKVLPDKEKCERVAIKAFGSRDVFRWSKLTEKYIALIDR
ncbi:MAG: glycosyltransferase family 4 protein [Candidatus Aminicenantes bacterium]|nr:glycosyltransferase family 4 protein [Candidatus Aminicenantes bacterium]